METPLTTKQLNKLINDFWKQHDLALSSGKTAEAQLYAGQAFELLALLPENAVYLSTKQ